MKPWMWIATGVLIVVLFAGLVLVVIAGPPITPKTPGDCAAKYHSQDDGAVRACIAHLSSN
jgi:hypothetical protein